MTIIVDVAAFENGDVVPGLFFDKIHAAVAARRHAAAFDFLRRNHRASVAGKNAQRGGALIGEEKALRAAEEKTDPIALFPVSLRDFRKNAAQRALRHPREHRFEVADACRQKPVQSQHIDETPNPELFIQPQRQCRHLHAAGMRDQSSEEPLLPFCRADLFLDVPHRERQVGRMNSDRAEIVAGHAGETAVHLLDEVGAELEFPFKTLAGERNAAARRGGFLEVFAIGRADGEAQSASDTIVILRDSSGFFSSKTKLQ